MCVCLCVCVCVCVRLPLCERPRKVGPRGVVLQFHSFINSPFAPAPCARMDGLESEDKQMEVKEFKGQSRQTVNTQPAQFLFFRRNLYLPWTFWLSHKKSISVATRILEKLRLFIQQEALVCFFTTDKKRVKQPVGGRGGSRRSERTERGTEARTISFCSLTVTWSASLFGPRGQIHE